MTTKFSLGETVQRITGKGGSFKIVAVNVHQETQRYQIKSLDTNALEWVAESEITLDVVH